ncbi:MAG TPA: NADP-dependent malic enzyme [Candidatus Saccharimonadales bacterium]|nr:NADP-dependent malic enzyme [Candidatus Saccharimonadales bacterium]
MDYGKKALRQHKRLGGKISMGLKDDLSTQDKLSTYYTPGVAAVSSFAASHPKQAREYTWLNNSVAVVSDGSAVLGLGNIGPYGALPVMEGKAMLFKHFADIDAVPIVLDVHSEDEIVQAVRAIAPSFGAVNLEDIAAPQCFAIEERLKKALNIPVMHDDQHGTAVVVLAGLINALKITGKRLGDCKIVIVGAGAAGTAVAKLLNLYAKPEILVLDSRGIISKSRADLNASKKQFLKFTNKSGANGSLDDALQGADIFIGLSKPDLLDAAKIKKMAERPLIFAMANPDPEIKPDLAKKAGAAVVATGRSDFPNQVNNALAFPGIFRGALDNGIGKITDKHKIAAAEAMASLVAKPTAEKILPTVLDKRLVPAIAKKIV